MLLRAFGPVGEPGPAVDPQAALAAARRFEMAPRIAARQGRERLAAELGAEGAFGFHRDQAGATAQGLRLQGLVQDVATVAAELSMPLVLLKFAALEASGPGALGRRAAGDVDLLVPAGRAGELRRTLLDRGWQGSGLPDAEHQLAALSHPLGGVVEIHRLVLGVRLDGIASATAEALEGRGLLAPVPGMAGRCFVPSREVQAAHTLVHGLGQHGWWPDSYPLLKMVADLIDLGLHEDENLARRAGGLVARDVAASEAEAVRRLCAALALGSDLTTGETGEAVVLRHILAGRLDERYAASLRMGLFRTQPSDRPEPVRLARSLLAAVFLTRAQIDAIYGPPRRPIGYLARRVARPFDLLVRLVRYGARSAWLKICGILFSVF